MDKHNFNDQGQPEEIIAYADNKEQVDIYIAKKKVNGFIDDICSIALIELCDNDKDKK